ncbi:MAG: helix-turn-helix transcriptional regulator [Solirubrobacterales bacterium]|nr:helix-turn-helix transcriptional regulator [Solirubrobacterales bacterium]
MVDPLPKVAANLRRLREEKGMTQDALASGAMMDPAEIRRIESGRRDPGVRVVVRLAKGLGVEPHVLLLDITG